MQIFPTISGWLGDLLGFCYPGRCAACDADEEEGSLLCEACRHTQQALEAAPACAACAKPLVEAGAPCPWCAGKGIRPYRAIIRLSAFQPPVKDLIHRMKYHRQWPLGEYLAERLWEQQRVRTLLREADCIAPVPLYRWRQISRGYNQAEVIARILCKHSGLRLVQPAVRLRHTETQTHLHSRARRVENLKSAFGLVRPKSIHGHRVVVVDDVVTTGATLEAFARALRPGKPACLSAIVIAVADPRGADFERV